MAAKAAVRSLRTRILQAPAVASSLATNARNLVTKLMATDKVGCRLRKNLLQSLGLPAEQRLTRRKPKARTLTATGTCPREAGLCESI